MSDTHPPSTSSQVAKVQAISGLIFSIFVLLHLMNMALATLGPSAFDAFQRTVRPIYQYPLVELGLVMTPLVVHIAAGVVRMRGRGRGADRKLASPRIALRTRLHRYSGYFLAFFIFGHIAATRLPSLLRDIYPEFTGVAWTFQAAGYFFYPYYTLLGLAGLYHAVHGSLLASGMLGLRVPGWLRKGPGFWVPTTASAVLVVLGVAGLGGLLYAVPDASAHPYAGLVTEVLQALGLEAAIR